MTYLGVRSGLRAPPNFCLFLRLGWFCGLSKETLFLIENLIRPGNKYLQRVKNWLESFWTKQLLLSEIYVLGGKNHWTFFLIKVMRSETPISPTTQKLLWQQGKVSKPARYVFFKLIFESGEEKCCWKYEEWSFDGSFFLQIQATWHLKLTCYWTVIVSELTQRGLVGKKKYKEFISTNEAWVLVIKRLFISMNIS